MPRLDMPYPAEPPAFDAQAVEPLPGCKGRAKARERRVRKEDPTRATEAMALAAGSGYQIKINAKNALDFENVLRVTKGGAGFREMLTWLNWRLIRIANVQFVYTTGTPSFWIVATTDSNTGFNGTWRDKKPATNYCAVNFQWMWQHWFKLWGVHELHHFFGEMGTPGLSALHHSGDGRSAVAQKPNPTDPLKRFDGGAWFGMLPVEFNTYANTFGPAPIKTGG